MTIIVLRLYTEDQALSIYNRQIYTIVSQTKHYTLEPLGEAGIRCNSVIWDAFVTTGRH